MKVIFHKEQSIGRILIERTTNGKKHQISIKRNNEQLYEDIDYSLPEIEDEKETTFIQDFTGQEVEVMILIKPPI